MDPTQLLVVLGGALLIAELVRARSGRRRATQARRLGDETSGDEPVPTRSRLATG